MVKAEPFFEALFDLNQTEEVPDDSLVVITDLAGSSQAIQQGKHREVNLVGAAAIAALRNCFGSKEIAYVFGGDGATFLIPARHQHLALQILKGVQELAQDRMNYQLRVGAFSAKLIRQLGGELRYGYLPTSPAEGFHFFRGNGLAIAERQLKSTISGEGVVQPEASAPADLGGLSCRLAPFQTNKRSVLSVLIEPRVILDEEDIIFKTLISELCGTQPLSDFKPLSLKNHRRPWVSSSWKAEAGLLSTSQVGTLIENILGTLLFKTNFSNPVLGVPSHYTDVMLAQSDWIKMDGTLRMVIDTTLSEQKRLNEALEFFYNTGKIFFGVAESDSCVMTCHLQSAIEDRHTHFVDGGQGGLTRASIQLKKQKQVSKAL